MAESHFHRLSKILWGVLVLLLLVLAVYVSMGRLLVSSLSQYQQALLQEINLRVPFTLEADAVRGEWHSFSPVFVLSGVRISLPDSDAAPLELTEGQLGVDVWSSLRSGSLQITHLIFDGLTLHGEFSSAGKLRLRGFASSEGESGTWLQQFLLNARQITLRDNKLRLSLPSGEIRDFDLNVQLTRRGSDRRAHGRLRSTRGTQIDVLARGLGNPFQPELFSGDLYVHVESAELGSIADLMSNDAPTLWAQGELEVAFWLNWEHGTPTLETSVEARDLLVTPRDDDWQLPLERVALRAHVARDKERWTLYAVDVALQNAAVALELPRLQIDAWGNSLRLRASDIPVANFAAFTAGLETTPTEWRQLITDLDPGGSLGKLQLNIADFQRPLDEWEFEANFNDVSLTPYRGAPGVTAAAGYAQLGSGGGTVVLDSRAMALSFPGIYAQPLAFDEFFGTVYLDWDTQGLALSSGLITATGDEGTVRALFGLDVPLQPNDIGVEMELLVGLADADVGIREKYVPEVLSKGLRDWLANSLTEGEIKEGAFLWRGALKRNAPELRTVQLGFNVSEAAVDYHPDWPAARVREGIVLVDDSRVSVWADSGALYDSVIRDVSVELAPNREQHLQLAVAGQLQGPAADGLAVVNRSPLNDLVGGAFQSWVVSGDLETDLDLHLQLSSDAPPPQVSVQTRWTDVDATISPGNLRLNELNGALHYSTEKGFSSRDLAGRLWGEKVQLDVHQIATETPGRDGAASALEVSAATTVAMSDLQEWLPAAPLALATGRTPVDIALQVVAGEAPKLRASSTLRGVSLDLPQPWQKERDATRELELSLSMASPQQLLELNLDEELALRVTLADGGLYSGALGIRAEAPASVPGEFRIGGAAPAVSAEEWFAFIQTYFVAQQDASTQSDATAMKVVVQDLSAESLTLQGQVLTGVQASLTLADRVIDAWVSGDWLRGTVRWPMTGEAVAVNLAYLDIARFMGSGGATEDVAADAVATAAVEAAENAVEQAAEKIGELTAGTAAETATEAETAAEPETETEAETEAERVAAAAEGAAQQETFLPPQLPPMAIDIAEIYRSEQPLGNLTFTVISGPQELAVQDIQGELAGLRMRGEAPASVRWVNGDEPVSQVRGRLLFDDLGATLSQFGYEKFIQTREGDIEVDVHWPGGLSDHALAQMGGSIRLNLDSGSFLSAPSGAAGALRVVSILNLVHIVQSLSVKHMFDTGIPFDSLEGEIHFRQGVIEVPSLDVKGGSKFEFSGISDVATQTLNGELVATLPVAKNLPWVAALAAGLPVAAGVFVVSKIFDKQVNKLSSAVYRLDGTWDDPRVSFDRMFDDASRGLPQRSDEPPDPNAVPAESGSEESGQMPEPDALHSQQQQVPPDRSSVEQVSVDPNDPGARDLLQANDPAAAD